LKCGTFSPDGKQLLLGDSQGDLWAFDTTSWTNKGMPGLKAHPSSVHHVAYAGDNRRALSVSNECLLCLWDLTSRSAIASLDRETLVGPNRKPTFPRFFGAALSPDGGRGLISYDENDLHLWDLTSKRRLSSLKGHEGPVLAVAFSPDGKCALSGSKDKTLRLWDLNTGKELHCFTEHEDEVTCVAFLPDGRRAVSGSRDTTIRLWRLPASSPK
jgi:WD40 repeat protein